TGKVIIDSSISAREACHEIGTIPPGKTIVVEDEAAKAVVLAELQAQERLAAKEIRVLVRPGGVSRIYDDIRAHANASRRDLYIVLDGDQKPKADPQWGKLPRGLADLQRL